MNYTIITNIIEFRYQLKYKSFKDFIIGKVILDKEIKYNKALVTYSSMRI